jgi:predicted helicase
VLDEKKIVGQKRLFMTATPRTYTTAAKTKAEKLDAIKISLLEELPDWKWQIHS